MCELCSEDPKERQAAMDRELAHVQQVEALARQLRAVATGRVKPHSPKIQKTVELTRVVIRYLASQWI